MTDPVLDTEVLVIGAGVVGLACARALAQAGRAVVVAEAAAHYGTGVSSRSSEVVHAGLYDVPGSLKARLCVRGRRLLQDYATARGVPLRRCGKLVVAAQPADVERLQALHARAGANGVEGLTLLTAAQAQALEPELRCAAALHSAVSGIVDSHALMTALLADAEAAGALYARASAVQSAWRDGGDGGHRDDPGASQGSDNSAPWCVQVQAAGEAAPFVLRTRWVVNAAGLDAQAVAAAMRGFPAAAIPARHLARGHYFALAGRSPFSRLIYPLPEPGGLGVHLTLDLGGQARFGPDVQWLDDGAAPGAALDYGVDPARAAAFDTAIRRWWPRLPPLASGALQPAYAGIRPKLSGPGQPAADFRIDGPAAHGVAGVVQLFGIESPGLTASLAVAECVAGIVAGSAHPQGLADGA